MLIPMQKNVHNYIIIYLIFKFLEESGRQNNLKSTVENIIPI